MYIPSKKIPLVHNLIENIYGATLNEVAIQTISRKTCSILDAHYFALMLFSGTTNPDPRVISNNPPEFLQAYNEVYKEDFLTKAVVTTGETSVLQRIPGWSDRKNQNFLATLASVRPASDGIYVPIKTAEGTMQGLWAIARAGLDSPPFSDNEIEVFHFISEFLSDAYKRSSLSSTMEDDIAFLDYQGHILQAGSRIQATFKEVFGLDDINQLPIAFNIAWYEQKAVIVLLALLYLGVKNIHLGPTLPAFLSPNVANVLVEKFGIGTINTVPADIEMFMAA